MEIEKDKLYTPEEVGKILGLHKSTVRKKCKNGEMICSNFGSHNRSQYRIKGSNILHYLQK